MSCKEVDQFLDCGPGAALPREAAEHLRSCERCRALFDGFQGAVPHGLAPQLQGRLEQAVLGSLEPVKPLPSARSLAAGFSLVFFAVAGAGAVALGVATPKVMNPVQLGVVFALLAGGAVLLAIALSREMLPGAYALNRLYCSKVLLAWLLPAFLLAVAALFPWRASQPFLAGFPCTLAGLLLSAPAAVLFWLLLRRGAVLSPGTAGAASGLLAGLAGALALHLTCIMAEAPHLAVWHVGVPVGCALAGFAIGRFAERRAPVR